MSESLQVACPHCEALNRVPATRLGDEPACGRCHKALFQRKPLALDATSFARHVNQSDVPLLVDFWAAWCGPCRTMAPQFEDAARRLEPAVRLGKIDTDAVPEIAGRFSIRSIPTLILFRGGREIARQSGAMSSADIERWTRNAMVA